MFLYIPIFFLKAKMSPITHIWQGIIQRGVWLPIQIILCFEFAMCSQRTCLHQLPVPAVLQILTSVLPEVAAVPRFAQTLLARFHAAVMPDTLYSRTERHVLVSLCCFIFDTSYWQWCVIVCPTASFVLTNRKYDQGLRLKLKIAILVTCIISLWCHHLEVNYIQSFQLHVQYLIIWSVVNLSEAVLSGMYKIHVFSFRRRRM